MTLARKPAGENIPARYRPTWRARFHHFFWSLILVALKPVALIFRGLERLRYRDR